MAIRDTTQLPQPIGTQAPLPHQVPTLPGAVEKRFPEVSQYNEEVRKWWKKTSSILSRSYDDLVLPLASLKQGLNSQLAVNGQLRAEITSLAETIIEGDNILSQRIDNIVASGSGTRKFFQSNPPTGANLNDEWFDIDDGLRHYVWDGTDWVDVSDGRIEGALAAVAAEQQARIDGDTALASDITTVLTRLDSGDIATAISSLQTAVGPSGSISTALTALTSQVNHPVTGLEAAHAAVTLEQVARTSQFNALASDVTSLEARLDTGDIATALSSLQTEVGPSGALATSLDQLASQVNDPVTGLPAAFTSISTIQTTFATQTYAQAMRDAAISAAFDDSTVLMQTEILLRSDADTALGQRIDNLAASSGNRIYRQEAAPTGVNIGDVWIKLLDGRKAVWWDGAAWQPMTESDLTAALSRISTVETTYASQTYAQTMRDDAISASIIAAGGYTDGQISALASVYATPTLVEAKKTEAIAASVATASTDATTKANAAEAAATAAAQLAEINASAYADGVVDAEEARAIADATAKANAAQAAAIAAAGSYTDGQISNLSSVYATPAFVEAKKTEAITAAVNSANSFTTGQISGLSSVYATPAFVESKKTEAIAAAASDATAKANTAEAAATAAAQLAEVNASAYADGIVDAEEARAIADATAKANAAQAAAIAAAASYTNGQISNLSSVYATPGFVEAKKTEAISAAVGTAAADAQGRVDSEALARASEDGVLSNRISLVEASVNTPTTGLLARVTTTESALAQRVGGNNRVRNSSFELDSNSDGLADGFAIYNNGGIDLTVSRVPGRLGGFAQSFNFTGTPNNTTQGIYPHAGTNLNWEPNRTYVLSFYARGFGGQAGRTIIPEWNIHPAITDTLLNPPLSGSWQRYAFRFVMGATVEPAGWVFISSDWAGAARNGELQFDDFQIEEGSVLTAYAPNVAEATNVVVASRITSVEAALQDPTTGLANAHVRVTDEANARATADGHLSGKRTLAVDVNGVHTGINISSSSGPGTFVSEILLAADSVKFVRSGSPHAPLIAGDAAYDVNANSTTISGDKIRSGLLQSNNWSGWDGSEYDLDSGTFRLGGSIAPKLSWDGSELTIRGNINAGDYKLKAAGSTFAVRAAGGGEGWSQGNCTLFLGGDLTGDRSASIVFFTGGDVGDTNDRPYIRANSSPGDFLADRQLSLHSPGRVSLSSNNGAFIAVDSYNHVQGSNFTTDGVYRVYGQQVVAGRQPAIADPWDPSGYYYDGYYLDLSDIVRAQQEMLTALRTHGLIAI